MLEALEKIISNVLTALYQPFGFAVIMAVLLMFFYLFAREKGLRTILTQWWQEFKNSPKFRIMFLLTFYVVMILFRTLLNRNMWANPLSDVIGPWGFYDKNGKFTTEAIENLMLFIPFAVLLLCTFKNKLCGLKVTFFKSVIKTTIITFAFSLVIEFLQLFFRIGTFQLSDLFYNTLGGFIGGLIYYIGYKIKEKTDSKKR